MLSATAISARTRRRPTAAALACFLQMVGLMVLGTLLVAAAVPPPPADLSMIPFLMGWLMPSALLAKQLTPCGNGWGQWGLRPSRHCLRSSRILPPHQMLMLKKVLLMRWPLLPLPLAGGRAPRSPSTALFLPPSPFPSPAFVSRTYPIRPR